MRRQKGQAILEYILLVLMLAVTFAIAIRNVNYTIYQLWTGMTRQISSPCVGCAKEPAPDF